MTSKLPQIPLIDAQEGGSIATAHAAEGQLRDLFRRARMVYTPPLLALADDASKRWLARSANPHLGEIEEIATIIGKKGAYALNTSYEWACTSGVGTDRQDGGIRLLRVLDWRLPGLGRNLVVARQDGPAGTFLNVTWPGFVGVMTAMAPGRFAAAINQPPMVSRGLSWPIDWVFVRAGVFRSKDVLPAHLLRRVFETCSTYREAKQTLAETPLCIPAFFTLAGIEEGEGCVIERTETEAAIREMPSAVANHWTNLPRSGRARGRKSRERQAMMEDTLAVNADWLGRPIRNRDTRVTAMMNPAIGRMTVQGWERTGPVTAPFVIGG